MMGEGLTAKISTSAIPEQPIFDIIRRAADIPMRDMYNTFNMGVGMILALPAEQADAALRVLAQAGETAFPVGEVVPGNCGVELV